MRKNDLLSAFIIGEVSSWLILAVFENIRLKLFSLWVLPVFLPIFAIIGLWLAFIIGKKFVVVWQIAKFALVGILNTLLDLGVLNLLILFSEIATGFVYSVFKGVSFTVAVINSYFWNKFWTFKKSNTVAPGKEFLQFVIISVIGFGINVGIASFIVNVISNRFAYSGVSERLWANIGAVIATFVAMAWNFIGYKFIVFKQESENINPKS